MKDSPWMNLLHWRRGVEETCIVDLPTWQFNVYGTGVDRPTAKCAHAEVVTLRA